MSNAGEKQVRTVIEDWAAALRTKNAARVLSHGVAGMVHFSLAPPLVANEDADGLKAWFATWQGPIGYEIHDLTVTAGDDVAFSHSLSRMTGTMSGGEKTDLWFRHTLGFRKIDGAWKIVHAHESVPFYMDGSDRAALDLKP